MNISWIIADGADLDPTIDTKALKNIGSLWGSWKTWRAFQTDNVICHDTTKADELIKRQFHKHCNFYIPNSSFIVLGRPEDVKVYQGDFVHELDHHEEIVSLHLASGSNDIVLLLGFDCSEQEKNPNKLLEHKAHNYRSLFKQAVLDNPQVQWVLVDHTLPLRKELTNLENLTQDSITNVIGMLSN